MTTQPHYEVVQRGAGWVLQRPDRTQLVQFPTRRQAIRAGLAIARDEGLSGLLIHEPDGSVRQLDPSAEPELYDR